MGWDFLLFFLRYSYFDGGVLREKDSPFAWRVERVWLGVVGPVFLLFHRCLMRYVLAFPLEGKVIIGLGWGFFTHCETEPRIQPLTITYYAGHTNMLTKKDHRYTLAHQNYTHGNGLRRSWSTAAAAATAAYTQKHNGTCIHIAAGNS